MLERIAKTVGIIVGCLSVATALLTLIMWLSGRASAMDLRKTQTDVNVLQVQQADLHDFMDRQDKRSERVEQKLDRAIELMLRK